MIINPNVNGGAETITCNISDWALSNAEALNWLEENVPNFETVARLVLKEYGESVKAYQIVMLDYEHWYGNEGTEPAIVRVEASSDKRVAIYSGNTTGTIRIHRGAVYQIIRKAVSE